MVITFLFLSLIFAVITLKLYNVRPKNFPPGPISFPIVGNYLNLLLVGEMNMSQQLINYGKKYGGIFSFDFGSFPGVIITDPKLAREALLNTVSCGRPNVETSLVLHGGLMRGIVCQEGENWRQLRGFTVHHLKEFGFGTKALQSMYEEEAMDLISDLVANDGKPISTFNRFNLPVINVMWRIVGGERLRRGDSQVDTVLKNITGGLAPTKAACLFFMPWLTRWMPDLVGWTRYKRMGDSNRMFLGKFIQSKLATFQDGVIEDFTDLFIQQIRDTKDTSSCFYGKLGEENLLACVADLFLGGTETSATTLNWIFLYLAVNPEKQEKLYEEIKQVLQGASPNLDDVSRMPYTASVLMESMRLSALIALNIFRCAMEDTTIGGYVIPKGTVISTSIYAVHHDPDVWGDPAVFRPERFLSPDEKSITKPDAYMPFSLGKRICPGLPLAKNTLFMFTLNVLQRFSITWDPSQPKPDINCKLSVVLAPQAHKLIFTARKSN